MEHYEGIVIRKKETKRARRIVSFGAACCALALCGYVAYSARARDMISTQSAIISHAFADAFGFSSDAGGMPEEIGLSGSGNDSNFDGAKGVSSSVASRSLPTKAKSPSKNKNAASSSFLGGANYSFPPSPSSSSSTPPPASAISAVANHSSTQSIANKNSAATYPIAISISGDGRGIVTSTPPGIACGTTCLWDFSAGQTVRLRATPDSQSYFGGWSGGCSGVAKDCSFLASGYVSVGAIFRSSANASAISIPSQPSVGGSTGSDQNISSIASSSDDAAPSSTVSISDSSSASSSDSDEPSSSYPSAAAANHLLVAAIQIGGAQSSNDFVKIFNPTENAIDASGWKLHKKSSTGTDYSLRELPKGTVIMPGMGFTWANSAGGFSDEIGADISSSETLSADNSAALLDASGTVVDAVAWGDGQNQYEEGNPYPTDPQAGQVLARIVSGGIMVDTDNNAADFEID